MAERVQTNEFSICLLPDETTAQEIAHMREQLPASPYRDDTPHITLLRGITAPGMIADEELLEEVGRITAIDGWLPIDADVREIADLGNEVYSTSSILLLEPSRALLEFRHRTIERLQQAGYMVEAGEQEKYTPHMTIRLGIPLEGERLVVAEQKLVGRQVEFGRWVLFRLELESGERFVREISVQK